MMRPYKLNAPASPVLPVAVGSAVAGAAVLSAAYYYQRRRKKKVELNEDVDHAARSVSDQKMPQQEETADEKDDY